MKPIVFRLNEFKAIAEWLDKKLPMPLAFFLKGWLWGLEDLYIDAKIDAALNEAEADYRALQGSPVEITQPTYYSQPSEVEGLDTIGYTYGFTDTRKEDKE